MNISQRLERLPMTKTMWKILLLVGVGWMFDAMDQGMVAGVLAAVGQTWELSALQQSMLASTSSLSYTPRIVPGLSASDEQISIR